MDYSCQHGLEVHLIITHIIKIKKMIGMYDEPVAVPIIDLLDSSMMS
jgi:hypothetical protein